MNVGDRVSFQFDEGQGWTGEVIAIRGAHVVVEFEWGACGTKVLRLPADEVVQGMAQDLDARENHLSFGGRIYDKIKAGRLRAELARLEPGSD